MVKIEIRSYRSPVECSPIARREKSSSWMIIFMSCLLWHQLPLTPLWWWPYHSPGGPLFASHSAVSRCLNVPRHSTFAAFTPPVPSTWNILPYSPPNIHNPASSLRSSLSCLSSWKRPICLLDPISLFKYVHSPYHYLEVDLCVFYLLLCLQCLPSILHLLNGWTNK